MTKRKPTPDHTPNPFEPLDGKVTDTIDLHGMSAAEALTTVTSFVQRAQRRTPGGLVHVITGKGRGSPAGPVLKTKVRTLLKAGTLPVAAWGADLEDGGYLIRLR